MHTRSLITIAMMVTIMARTIRPGDTLTVHCKSAKCPVACAQAEPPSYEDAMMSQPGQSHTTKKKLVQLRLDLMVNATTAHAAMRNDDIMKDAYATFAATQHNMDVHTLITNYFKEAGDPLVFNMYWMNRKLGLRFTRLINSTVKVTPNEHLVIEVVTSNQACTYTSKKTIDGSEVYDDLFIVASTRNGQVPNEYWIRYKELEERVSCHSSCAYGWPCGCRYLFQTCDN
jgi:hypothetical protein